MTKTIITIAGVLTIMGIAAAAIFGTVDILTAGTIATTVLGLLWGWYERVDKNEIKEELTITKMQLEDRINFVGKSVTKDSE